MITPLKSTALHELLNEPVLFDANIFMVGIENRGSDKNCSFDNMKKLFIEPLFQSFTNILIHEEVYKELDEDARNYIDSYIGKNVSIVSENSLYGSDPLYTTIFNNISSHSLVRYSRGKSKDRGEVYSLAYAAYHGINYFCSREIMVDNVAHDLSDLQNVKIITFDIVLLQAYVYYANRNDTTNNKALKAVYKKYCHDVIRRHKLPGKLSDYVRESIPYI